jgi:SnoaL-like domain
MHDLQYLLDYQQLRDIIIKAAIALDSRRYDDWMDLCTSDVVLDIPIPDHPIRCEGKAAFRKQLTVLDQFEATTHFTGNTLATIEGDAAEAETYCLAHHLMRNDQGRTNLRQSVRYHDSFVRQDGVWLMSRRHLVIDWSELTDAPEPSWQLD